MLFIVLLGILGAVVAFFILWPFWILIAGLGAVLGGSVCAALAAVWLGRTSTRNRSNSLENKVSETSSSQVKTNSSSE
jgi:hypothetical protein